jgi:hypothetical protein
MQSMIRSKGGRCKQRERICAGRRGRRSASVIVRVDGGVQRVVEGRGLIDHDEVTRVVDRRDSGSMTPGVRNATLATVASAPNAMIGSLMRLRVTRAVTIRCYESLRVEVPQPLKLDARNSASNERGNANTLGIVELVRDRQTPSIEHVKMGSRFAAVVVSIVSALAA